MASSAQHVYVKRGEVVKGPVSTKALASWLQSQKILPSDLVATSPQGPWRRLADVVRRESATVPVVADFRVKRSFFGGGYAAVYSCPHCNAPLQADEASWGTLDTCPTCNSHHRLAREVRDQAASDRRAIAEDQARRARDRELQQQRKAQEREAERMRKEEARRVRDQERAARDAARAAEQAAARERRQDAPRGPSHASGPSVGDVIEAADAIQSLFDLFSGE